MTATLKASPKATASSVAEDPRWARIVARDKTADGHLWYSVVTTGVYCRPSCPSRVANPQNVQLHDNLESARGAVFRPCNGCNPEGLSADAENAALVAKVCRMIEESEEEPSLEELAEVVGRSPSYFHRIFKATTGVTPKEYATAHRAAKVRHGLISGSTVTEAIYDAGFNSSGRFYEKINRHAWHDSLSIPRGRGQRGHQIRSRPDLARCHIGRVDQKGRGGHPSRKRSRRTGPRPPGPLPEGTSHRRRRRL